MISDAIASVLSGKADELETALAASVLTELCLNFRSMLHLMLEDKLRDNKGRLTQPADPFMPAWNMLPEQPIDKENETIEEFRARFAALVPVKKGDPRPPFQRKSSKKQPAMPPVGSI